MLSHIVWHILTNVSAFCCLTASRDVDKPVAADTEFVIKLVSELECCLFEVDLHLQWRVLFLEGL